MVKVYIVLTSIVIVFILLCIAAYMTMHSGINAHEAAYGCNPYYKSKYYSLCEPRG